MRCGRCLERGGRLRGPHEAGVDKAEREALAEAGLITFEKRKGGAFWLDVTDRGWRWAEEHLSHPLPDRTQGGAFVLRAWLARLQAFMQARNIGLAEVLGPQAAARCESSAGEATARDDDDRPALRERIRKAYLEVTGGSFNKRALLSEVRARLEDVHRLDLDEALKHMQQNDEASLMQLDNSVEITEADRTAALYIGREPRHILWIFR